MFDLKLDSSHDLDASLLDLKLVGNAEQVAQQLLIKLRLWRGEWFLDTEFGTPYIENILGKQLTLSGVIAAIKKSILEVDGVQNIEEFTFAFSNQTRKLEVTFKAVTPYGIIEVAA